jgi:hypothetical protein
MFGTGNIVRGNTIHHYFSSSVDRSGEQHPDIVQVFFSGDGTSMNWVFERNYCYDFVGPSQLGNCTSDGALTIDGAMIRNNIFENFERTFNLFAPNYKFYNNTFYNCCNAQNSHCILGSSIEISPGGAGTVTIVGSTKTMTITGTWGAHMAVGQAVRIFGSVNNTGIYTVDEIVDTQTATFVEAMVDEGPSATLYPKEYGGAEGLIVKNNIFIGCGGTNDATSGWYLVDTWLQASQSADYNYVSRKPIAGYTAKTGFSETNGINGGNPYLFSIDSGVAGGYALTANSTILIGEGVDLSAYFTDDYAGNPRGTGTWDIGAYDDGTPGSGGGGGPPATVTGLMTFGSGGGQFTLSGTGNGSITI